MKSITVFTPTYNRSYCLHQVYDSLVAQTSQDFIWLIIDDGSADDTKQKVTVWQSENKIEIQYIFQQNQGMHGAHNTAYQNIQTELNVCVDSDDYLSNDAIETILAVWNHNTDAAIAGIIGLDAHTDGAIVGTKIPETISHSGLSDLYLKHGVTGDKKVVLRTAVVKQFPSYPLFEGERFVPLGVLYLMIDQQYQFICSNEVVCIVEYLADGSSLNIFKQYQRNPQGFGYSRLVEMQYSKNVSYTFTRAMHYVSSCMFSGNWNIFKDNPKKAITFLALPFGLLLHCYILIKIAK